MTSSGVTALALTAILSVGFAAYQAGRYVSLERGIAQAQQNINLIDKEINSTAEEVVDLAKQTLIGKLGTSAQIAQDVAGIGQAYNQNDIQGLVQHLGEAAGDISVAAIKATGEEMAAEGVAAAGGPNVVAIKESFDAGVDVIILSNIGARLAQLEWVKHAQLEPALESLENKQQELVQEQKTAALWEKLQSEFQETSAKSMAGKDAGEVLKQAASVDPRAAAEIGRGIAIRDPQQSLHELECMPGLNPDFIAAMEAEFYIATQMQSDARWGQFTATRYPDGTYIPAFGPCRGIDIPNPISGGLIASSTAACRSGHPVQTACLSIPETPSSTSNDSPLAFTTGPSETETIYVKGDNGSTGIGLFSQSVDQQDFGDNWELYDSSGTSIVHDPRNPDMGRVSKGISGSVSPRDPKWYNAWGAPSGTYVAKTSIVGMEPFSVSVRPGYITWVKIPHAVIQVGWDEVFHDALGSQSLSSGILILDSKAQSIGAVLAVDRSMRDGVYVDENWRRTDVKPGNYTVAIGMRESEGFLSTKGQWTLFPGYLPSPVTAVAGQVTRCKLVLGGFTISTDSANYLEWAVLSPDMRHEYSFPRGQLSISRESRSTDCKLVHILYPGHYELIWGNSMDLSINHKYRGKRDFTVTESEVTNLIIPAK
jgi:hypothetical protein